MTRSQAYLVRKVESSTDMEQVLNQSLQSGYRYRDAIPVQDSNAFGKATRTVSIFVVLEHIDVAHGVAAGDSPGASAP